MYALQKSNRALLLALLVSLPTHAEIYKCEESGKTVYRDKPCNGAAIEETLQSETNDDAIPEFKITAEEQIAIIKGTEGMIERLGDPQWLKLMQENKPGCWRTKEELVPEGQSISFESVVSRCVKLGKGIDAAYLFIPSRIIHYCQDTNTQLEICLDKLDGQDNKESPLEKPTAQAPPQNNTDIAVSEVESHHWVIEKADLVGRWTDLREENPLRTYWTFGDKTLKVKKGTGYTISATYTLKANKLIVHHKADEFRKEPWDEEIELISHNGDVLTWNSIMKMNLYKLH